MAADDLRSSAQVAILDPAALRAAAPETAMARLREPPGEARLAELADAWRPLRSWVALLLRAQGEATG